MRRRVFYRSLAPFRRWWSVLPERDWAGEFGRDAPLDLEIGAGNGEFLTRRATEHPERNLIGLDLRWSSLIRSMRRLDEVDASHVRLLQVDARVALDWLFPARSLAQVFVLFPCPWRKEKTAKNRLLDPAFLRVLNHCLEDGGQVEVATDFRPFHEWVLEQLPGTGFQWRRETVGQEWGTRYERKWAGQGQQEFFRIRMTKTEHQTSPVRGTVEMETHHIDRFEPRGFRVPDLDGPVTARQKELLYDPAREVAMIRFVIVEDHLRQNVWIRVARDGDHWKVYPASGTACVPTHGVQLVLDRLRDTAQLGAASASETDRPTDPSRAAAAATEAGDDAREFTDES